MNKSILTAFICVLTTFSISLLSCDESNGIGTEAADTNEITAAAPLMIAENGKALYKIIRAEEANTLLVNEVISFRRSLEEKTGISFKLETDWLKTGAKPDMNAPEITVGITNRNISVALGTVGNFKYSVKINGNKLEILAGDSSALRAAIDMFLSDEVLYMENDNVYVKGLPLSGKANLAAGE
ncbi:MAG: hypothetical protein PHZ09_10090, partial [Eubacteriales bacterium]|nr:hypothetical protein [Eubacteriales bacterium]